MTSVSCEKLQELMYQGAATLLPSLFVPSQANQPDSVNTFRETIEATSQAQRARRQEESDESGGTAEKYGRWWKEYTNWWWVNAVGLVQANPGLVPEEPLPITPAKAAIFLDYVTSRNKRDHKGVEIPNSSLSVHSVKSCINALENLRLRTQHEHKNDPDAQRPLREDLRIKMIEKRAQADEKTHEDEAMKLKAVGTSAGN
ncbi:hypothetical protein PM082_009846 [Marasmius tenuissimus]|nr:hypothetical protein PM082_009846 [Marasmius tenuissimus]